MPANLLIPPSMTPLPLSFQIQSCNVLTPSTSTSTFTGDFASKQIKDIHTANPKQKRKMNMLQFNPNLQSSQEFRFGPKRPRQLQLHNHGHMDAHVQILHHVCNLLALFLFFFFLIFYFKYDFNVCYERDANFLF